MYRGFQLDLSNVTFDYFDEALAAYNEDYRVVSGALSTYVGENGILNGSQLQKDWFPILDADVFLSHSHGDKDNAIALAGWLNHTFGLSVFIDSCVWGYSNHLLRMVDEKYCRFPDGSMFNYDLRNQSTSHIHMMLATALSMMMDKAECLFFLNTPNSIQTRDAISKTESPWIYHEIAMSRLLRRKPLDEHESRIEKGFSNFLGEITTTRMMSYDVSLEHLQLLNSTDLNSWGKKYAVNQGYALDALYSLFPASGRKF